MSLTPFNASSYVASPHSSFIAQPLFVLDGNLPIVNTPRNDPNFNDPLINPVWAQVNIILSADHRMSPPYALERSLESPSIFSGYGREVKRLANRVFQFFKNGTLSQVDDNPLSSPKELLDCQARVNQAVSEIKKCEFSASLYHDVKQQGLTIVCVAPNLAPYGSELYSKERRIVVAANLQMLFQVILHRVNELFNHDNYMNIESIRCANPTNPEIYVTKKMAFDFQVYQTTRYMVNECLRMISSNVDKGMTQNMSTFNNRYVASGLRRRLKIAYLEDCRADKLPEEFGKLPKNNRENVIALPAKSEHIKVEKASKEPAVVYTPIPYEIIDEKNVPFRFSEMVAESNRKLAELHKKLNDEYEKTKRV